MPAFAIVGDQLPDRRLAPLIPNGDAAAQEWAKRHGGLPINHMMVIRNTISKSRPDRVNEIYRMLRASRRMVPPPEGSLVDPWRFGVEANRGSLEIIIDYSFRQKLISRMFSVDELFKGAKPANLPVEQPTKFGLVINLKTAKALDLSVPRQVQQIADEIIE